MELSWVLYGTGFLVLALVFLLLSKRFFDLVTPYDLNAQLTEKDNPAMGVVLVGYILGIVAVICGVLAGGEATSIGLDVFLAELGPVALYAVVGVVLLLLAGIVNDRVILRQFSCNTEIIERRNTSVGVVVGCTYLGSGLIIGGSLHGSTALIPGVVAFLAAQVALVLFAVVYQRVTSYDDQEEIGARQNLAAGLAFGGNVVAYSLILMQGAMAAAGSIGGTVVRVRLFVYYAVAGAVLLPLVRLVNDRFFLPKTLLSEEIVKDRNTNAGLLEAGLAIAMGAVLICCL